MDILFSIWGRLKDRDQWPRRWWYARPAGIAMEVQRVDLGPASQKTEELGRALNSNSETVRRTMLTLLGLAFFCLMTTFGTPDISLLMAGTAIRLPYADVPVSFLGFLIAAPLLLIVIVI
jgi:hypothetical protein